MLQYEIKNEKDNSIGIFSFLKAHFTSFQFYEIPTLVPVFTNQKKSEEDFYIYEKKKGKKTKLAFSVCFAVRRHRGHVYSK